MASDGSAKISVFPAPAPATVIISQQDDEPEPKISPFHSPDGSTESRKPKVLQFVNVASDGPQNDDKLETLSLQEEETGSGDTADAEEFVKRSDRRRTVSDSGVDEAAIAEFMQTEHGRILQERLTALVAAFRARSLRARQLVMQPPPAEHPKPEQPPATDAAGAAKPDANGVKKPEEKRKPATQPKKLPEQPAPVGIKVWKYKIAVPELFFRIRRPKAFDSHSRLLLGWLFVVSLAFIYNAIVIPYRAAFVDPHNDPYFYIWLIFDYICDAIYIADLVIFKPSLRTYVNGIEISDHREITRKYVQQNEFILDVLCLLPLDFFYLVPEVGINPLLRIPRMLKVLVYWEFLDRIDQIAVSPWNYYFRVLRSVSYMMYLIHANACVFYYFSYLMDFDPNNGFVYNNFQPACQNATNPGPRCNFPGQYNAYIFCFFFSVSMVTIIGNLNFPGLVPEMIYSVILWFIGVFIFATIVGQIRDVLKAMTRHEDEFYEVMDEIVEHMHTLKIPKELQDRVRTWLLFNWEQQKTIDERHLLDGLPSKLRTDLAMEVHFGTIHKVQLFKEVDKKVLEELLVRLRPTVYLAGDYICRKGEIGKEMYIVKEGMLEVVLPDGRVAVTLGPGSVFGEISLLALAGGNRRTADVRSKGFTNLYVLTKADLNDVLKDYPETMDALRNKAHELMNKGKPPPERAVTPPPEEVIHTRAQTPEMVKVAISILKEGSKVRNRMYSQSAHELKVHTADLHDDTDDDEVSLSLGTATEGENGHVTPQPVADVTADMLMQEELVQKTELISPNTEEIISPSLEEQVLQEFAHNHEADRQSAGSLQPPAAESDSASAPAPRKSSKMRRKSRANHDADAKSSSDSDDNAGKDQPTSKKPSFEWLDRRCE
ncbi:hypothetical protein RvY_04699-1 [Ramazzottius varieornatus]|uniref:Cyclic nucleotide-binding domain-containing protein n=1 Tax=Ramazzottius varieornatus TaxID=947166 RepID=A0A1D1USJ7_RAMVA|nr:hypothetical protein RvY_04699-1 [Ramazzottius varieornatus]